MNVAMTILDWLFALLCSAGAVLSSRRYLHMLQLESYQGKMYLKWVLKRGLSECVPCLASAVAAIFMRVRYHDDFVVRSIVDGMFALHLIVKFLREHRFQVKKPLVYTDRIKRLLAVLSVFSVLVGLGFFMGFPNDASVPLHGILRYIPGLLPPLTVFAAYLLAYPMEEAIKRRYSDDAKQKLAVREDLIKIGITGSYGKTSTKYILGTILSERYSTLITPGSFNTPMGVTRVIREQLEDTHQVFVAEMGARYVGDIRELCELVRPQCGILTAVGRQHLETFGSYENVLSTKAELLDALSDGCAFVNGDNSDCVNLYESCKAKEKYLFGIKGESLYMRAGDVHVSREGSTFTLFTQDGGSVACSTKLLGRHNILNIAAAAACAYRMGLTLEEIAQGIAKVEPVEHRLQLIPGPVTVIDDAFNSNPAGVRAALDVLAQFDGRHIVVTPGMVELGDEEEALNEAFGARLAKCADIVILVGEKRTAPIRRGLVNARFDERCIVTVSSLKEASEKLPLYTEPGAVVLFENDLPDNYSE